MPKILNILLGLFTRNLRSNILIMALVAIPFALSSPRTGGRAVGIGVAILISVGYWVIHSIAIAFAKAELLPPLLGAWTANIVFAGVGAALFLRART